MVPDFFLNFMIKRVLNKVIIKMRQDRIFETDKAKAIIEKTKDQTELIRKSLQEIGVHVA